MQNPITIAQCLVIDIFLRPPPGGRQSASRSLRQPDQNTSRGHCGQTDHPALITAKVCQRTQQILHAQRGQRKRQPLDDQDQSDASNDQGHGAAGAGGLGCGTWSDRRYSKNVLSGCITMDEFPACNDRSYAVIDRVKAKNSGSRPNASA